MSEKEERYKIEIAQSDKKSSTVVNSFKVRKSGNSSIVTVPNVVKETLGIKDGEEIQYITVKNENDESMIMMKKLDNGKEENEKKFDKLLEETFGELDDILEALVEL